MSRPRTTSCNVRDSHRRRRPRAGTRSRHLRRRTMGSPISIAGSLREVEAPFIDELDALVGQLRAQVRRDRAPAARRQRRAAARVRRTPSRHRARGGRPRGPRASTCTDTGGPPPRARRARLRARRRCATATIVSSNASAEPRQRLDELVGPRGLHARRVEILEPQQRSAAARARVEPRRAARRAACPDAPRPSSKARTG